MGTIISAIIDGALTAALNFIQSIIEKRALVRQGQAQQAAAETSASEAAEARMGQAIADAPQSKDEALARLRGGTA